MSDLIERFGAETFDYNDISPSRRRQQPIALHGFADWLTSEHGLDLAAAGGGHLAGYLGTRVADGLAPATVRKELNMIRPFYGWLWRQHLITAEQLMEFRDVKPPRGSANGAPRPYTPKQQQMFWRALEKAYPWAPGGGDLERGEYFMRRWRNERSAWTRVQPWFRRAQMEAIVGLALYGGIRKDEIFRLKLEDMHPENAYIVVWSARKNAEGTHTWRAVPWLVPEMRERVATWLALREEIEPAHDRPWLTLRPSNHALNPMQFRAFGQLMCDLKPGFEFHRLRHTAATEMLRSGMSIEIVQKILGHSNIAQTLRYAKLVENDVLNGARRMEALHARRMTLIRYPEATT